MPLPGSNTPPVRQASMIRLTSAGPSVSKLDTQRPKAVVPQGLALIQQIELLPVQDTFPAGAWVRRIGNSSPVRSTSFVCWA